MANDFRRSHRRDGIRGTVYLVMLAGVVLACGVVISAVTRLLAG